MFTTSRPLKAPAAAPRQGSARASAPSTSTSTSAAGAGAPSGPAAIPGRPETNRIVKEYFGAGASEPHPSAKQAAAAAAASQPGFSPAFDQAEARLLAELESEVRRATDERTHVERVKAEVERERQRLNLAKTEFEREVQFKRKELDAMKEEEERKAKRDRRVLEKQASGNSFGIVSHIFRNARTFLPIGNFLLSLSLTGQRPYFYNMSPLPSLYFLLPLPLSGQGPPPAPHQKRALRDRAAPGHL